MSTRINLQIHRLPDIDLIDYGVIDTRILCKVLFPPNIQVDKIAPVLAIVDTGAPMSVIPQFIWSKCFVRTIQEESYLSGIIPGPAHMMETKIGMISAELLDKTGNRYPISFCAHLAPLNRVPVILGMQDVLEKAIIHIDIKGANNWLEFK